MTKYHITVEVEANSPAEAEALLFTASVGELEIISVKEVVNAN